MTAEEIITSGKIELYVCGSLPTDETQEVEEAIALYPQVKTEVERIEATLINLAEAISPTLSALVWTYILESIRKVRTLDSGSRTNWAAITGWAAAILFLAGIFWMLKENNNLQDNVQVTTTENVILKEKVTTTESDLAAANEVLTILRSKEYNTYTLPGNQAVAPEAFAKVYYNRTEKIAYIDSKGLPPAPNGKVYQVWSLIMDPLTPTSVGLLSDVAVIEGGIYKFENIPDPEAFGITLEPEGGSETPTLNQLYTLGMVTP